MVGTAIAHYRLLEQLGEGGMGEVYLVEDTRLQRRAALKLLSHSVTRDEGRRQRLVQEARLAASIDHPHIAAVYDVGEFDGRTFIVMEYVEGRSLREVLRDGPIKLRKALDYAIEAGDALAKVHERGVIHRDLKPENLLIAKDGYLKVIDFGLAKLTDSLPHAWHDAATMADDRVRTADGVVMGTVGYMSPEQVRGEPVDARSDIFSFGAVLFEMVAGTGPFRRKSPADTISAILHEMPPAPSVEHGAAGPELQRIVRKCLAKDPGSRYQGMRDLLVDLRELRDTPASPASVPHPVQATPEPGRAWFRRPVLVAATFLAVLVAAVIGWSTTRPRTPVDTAANPVRPAVAVVPFEMIGGNQDAAWLSKGLPAMLITGLAQTPDIEMIGNERLSDAARQLGAASLEAVERSRLADLARRAGARYVLNGTIVQSGSEIRIDARVEDLVTGGVRVAETVSGSNALTIADDLAARVRRALDVDATSGAVRRVADVSTSSVEAYRAYIAGIDAQFNLRLDDAGRLLREAVQLDPTFGLAYFHLATVSDFAGRIRESEVWLRQAVAHADRMPERDALLVRAQLARANGRVEEANQLLEGLVKRYPDTEIAWIRLGFPYTAVDPEQARIVFERATAALPQSAALLNLLGYGQLVTNRFDAALRSFEGYAKLRPSESNALDSLAEGYLVSGRPADALSTFKAAAEGGFSGGHSGAATALAVLGRYDEALSAPSVSRTVRALLLSRVGQYREAELALAAVRGQYESNGWPEGIASVHLASATYGLERGRCQEARRDVAAAEEVLRPRPESFAAPWRVYADLVVGVCDARAGRMDEARKRIEHARRTHRSTSPLERWWLSSLEGEVALASGDAEGAARAYAIGMPTGRMMFVRQVHYFMLSVLANNLILRDGPARIAVEQGRTAEAIAIYRRLVSAGPEQPWTAALEPRYVLALGRLLEKSGDRESARAEYRRFLEYWKNADANLPELAEAHAALAR